MYEDLVPYGRIPISLFYKNMTEKLTLVECADIIDKKIRKDFKESESLHILEGPNVTAKSIQYKIVTKEGEVMFEIYKGGDGLKRQEIKDRLNKALKLAVLDK